MSLPPSAQGSISGGAAPPLAGAGISPAGSAKLGLARRNRARPGEGRGARQIVQQHVVADVEQVPPSSRQVVKDRLLVDQRPVMTAVQLVDLGEPSVLAQQIGPGTAPGPLAVQPAF